MKSKRAATLILALLACLWLTGCESLATLPTSTVEPTATTQPSSSPTQPAETITLDSIPPYDQQPYVVLQDNVPGFQESDWTTQAFETYSPLDELGRCGVAYANICKELMPTEERGEIGQVKPSGWHTVTYDVVDGRYLYNRCHLIGFQLAGENANKENLITGTRYLNVVGMLPFENEVANYVEETGNHVLYRVTPIFQGDNLVASGVQMEAYSVEDRGEGVCFHVYVYNVQPGVGIKYETGESWLEEETSPSQEVGAQYVLNTSSKKFHLPSCSSVDTIKEGNRQDYQGSREALVEQGYTPCGACHP